MIEGSFVGIVVHVMHVAKKLELKILYTHVKENNWNALALYDSLWYVLEEEGPLEANNVFQRPRGGCLAFGFPKISLAYGYVSYSFLNYGQSCIQVVTFKKCAVIVLYIKD